MTQPSKCFIGNLLSNYLHVLRCRRCSHGLCRSSVFDLRCASPEFQHEYQIFSVPELQRSFSDHISVQTFCLVLNFCLFSSSQFACSSMADLTNFATKNIWTVVGEWSTAVTDCALWLNGRGVGARWDGTWFTSNVPLGSCDGWTGSSSNFTNDYKTFLRQ